MPVFHALSDFRKETASLSTAVLWGSQYPQRQLWQPYLWDAECLCSGVPASRASAGFSVSFPVSCIPARITGFIARCPEQFSCSSSRWGGSIPRGWGSWHCGKGAAAPPRSPPGYRSGLTQPAAACYSGNTHTCKQQPLAQGWERTNSTQHLRPRPCLQTL